MSIIRSEQDETANKRAELSSLVGQGLQHAWCLHDHLLSIPLTTAADAQRVLDSG
jgi:hypothetical protein